MDTNNNTEAQGAQRNHQGEVDMYAITNEIETRITDSESSTRRETDIGNGWRVSEYAAKNSDYQSVDVSAHEIDFASIKTTNRTITLGSREKVKIKIISFTDNEGIKHEINLFSERY